MESEHTQTCGKYGLARLPRELTTVPKPLSITCASSPTWMRTRSNHGATEGGRSLGEEMSTGWVHYLPLMSRAGDTRGDVWVHYLPLSKRGLCPAASHTCLHHCKSPAYSAQIEVQVLDAGHYTYTKGCKGMAYYWASGLLLNGTKHETNPNESFISHAHTRMPVGNFAPKQHW